jgi:caa(3)-type oxidase subunit IV
MTTAESETAVAHREEHAHPGARTYVIVALWLMAFTTIEVILSYSGLEYWTIVVGLTVLMLTKFTGVVLWYMHLRFDPTLFSVMFVGGLTLAVVVFFAVLTIQGVLFG